MTCIVGLVHDGDVYISGDSAGISYGGTTTIRADQKVFAREDMIFGFTSSFRMGQVLRYVLGIPGRKENISDEEYLVTQFIPEVQKCFKDAGYLCIDNGVQWGGTFLLGYRGNLYQIDSDFQVGCSVDEYDAVGAGAEYALGALGVLRDVDPDERLRRALEIACYHNAYVRPPYVSVRLQKMK